MVGIIVTGHGRFASGLTSSIDLIAGPQEKYVAVNFEQEVDQLTADLTNAIESLQDCDGIIVFSVGFYHQLQGFLIAIVRLSGCANSFTSYSIKGYT